MIYYRLHFITLLVILHGTLLIVLLGTLLITRGLFLSTIKGFHIFSEGKVLIGNSSKSVAKRTPFPIVL